jgi:endonuclease III related protein
MTAVSTPRAARRKPTLQPGKTSPKNAYRLRRLYNHLLYLWGPQQWWPARTSLEVVVGAYLTQSTSWKSVEHSLANLEAHGLLSEGKQSVEALHAIPEEELRTLIRPSGYMMRKAASIKAFIAFLIRDYEGSLELLAAEPAAIAREKLLALPGVGPETADAILLYALGQPAMVVDEYLRRLVTRHRLLPEGSKYPVIQALAAASFDEDSPKERLEHYNEFHALVVEVGKRHCGPKPNCTNCPLSWDLNAER